MYQLHLSEYKSCLWTIFL